MERAQNRLDIQDWGNLSVIKIRTHTMKESEEIFEKSWSDLMELSSAAVLKEDIGFEEANWKRELWRKIIESRLENLRVGNRIYWSFFSKTKEIKSKLNLMKPSNATSLPTLIVFQMKEKKTMLHILTKLQLERAQLLLYENAWECRRLFKECQNPSKML